MASVTPLLSPTTKTLDDLLRVEGKAELIAGRIVPFMPSGFLPSQVAFEIAVRLREYAKSTGQGIAFADGIGFALRPPLKSGRQSFSPDASFFVGAPPRDGMKFVEGAPLLAVEVRSEGDYSARALADQAAKRADYFEAGTAVVWDVDPLAGAITAYRGTDLQGQTFHGDDLASAEPALPGFRVCVREIMK